ncbi:helix-turn-helix domain-containing protein [Vagococcus acidifermentans]|uniref:HTH cro/C1-type domain-containing protein n=1 Tax=Vagococcus acidifermentans TaxID=564710 RepID=A0A430AT31_9ENTE|nr:helix-turn-helix domain-containing protein [Vagococcus acidifermentans]RSU11210.1 hypothetical protein CBF27_08925 [Vagococcus acidifermentans]
MEIGKVIKQKRTELNLTQEDLAKELFVSRQLISKWENGKSYPDLEQVVKLSERFNLSLDELLKGDEYIVKELTFDTAKKKLLEILLVVLTIATISLLSIIGFGLYIDGAFLQYNDITVTKVEKKILPEKKVSLPGSGEIITLPEDVETTIHFKTDKPFVHLANRSGLRNAEDSENIQVFIHGEYKLFGGNKESTIVILSQRENIFNDYHLNIGRSICITDPKKERKAVQTMEDGTGPPSIKDTSKLLVSWDEIEKLPDTSAK